MLQGLAREFEVKGSYNEQSNGRRESRLADRSYWGFCVLGRAVQRACRPSTCSGKTLSGGRKDVRFLVPRRRQHSGESRRGTPRWLGQGGMDPSGQQAE